jgi:two-component system chemotaxis response regulator CheY
MSDRQSPPPLSASSGARGKWVLVVDDSKTTRDMIRFILTNAGYAVLEAEHGQKGLDALRDRTVDLIITDLNMPVMDGLDLIRAVRKGGANRLVPILLLTTERDGAKKDEGRTAGANGWLVKPFQPPGLVAAVERITFSG